MTNTKLYDKNSERKIRILAAMALLMAATTWTACALHQEVSDTPDFSLALTKLEFRK